MTAVVVTMSARIECGRLRIRELDDGLGTTTASGTQWILASGEPGAQRVFRNMEVPRGLEDAVQRHFQDVDEPDSSAIRRHNRSVPFEGLRPGSEP
jgi:hypothetical protein